jgi:hypothetical protein
MSEDAKIIQMPAPKEVIKTAPNGQVEVNDIPKPSPLPTLAQEAEGAVIEGDALVERLAEGPVTISADDPEAEVIRALVSVTRAYAELATISLLDIREYANERLAAMG